MTAGARPLRAYVRRGYAVSEWQDIETAPKDGTMVLGARQCLNKTWDMTCVFYFAEDGEGAWWDNNADYICTPTHWMPLPEPPNA